MEEDYNVTAEQRADVLERYKQIEFPDPIMEPVWFGRYTPGTKMLARAAGKRAIVDRNTGELLSICSEQYKIVRYEDIITMVEDVVSGLSEYGEIEVVPDLMSNGGKLKVTLKFPDVAQIIREGSED